MKIFTLAEEHPTSPHVQQRTGADIFPFEISASTNPLYNAHSKFRASIIYELETMGQFLMFNVYLQCFTFTYTIKFFR